MKIARAQPDDAEVLTDIAFAAKRHWGYPENWIARWTESLTVTPRYLTAHPAFAAVVDDRIVGFYALQHHATDAWLDHLWVLPVAMRRGVGRALFAHAETTARDAGAILLKIEGDPHAVEFYRRMGAVVFGQRPAQMDEHPRFLPLLEKTL